MSDFDRFSLTIARWLTNVYDEDNPAKNYTTPGDVTRGSARNPTGTRNRGGINDHFWHTRMARRDGLRSARDSAVPSRHKGGFRQTAVNHRFWHDRA